MITTLHVEAHPVPDSTAGLMHLGFDVFSGQTLCDDVDALAVSQDVSSALRVVHQSFDATNQ